MKSNRNRDLHEIGLYIDIDWIKEDQKIKFMKKKYLKIIELIHADDLYENGFWIFFKKLVKNVDSFTMLGIRNHSVKEKGKMWMKKK